MSLFQNIYAQTFPYLADQTPEFDASNLTPGFNDEESPAPAATNNFIPYAPQDRSFDATSNDSPDKTPDLTSQIDQLGDIGQAIQRGQRYQEPPPTPTLAPVTTPTPQPDFSSANPYGPDRSSNPVDPVTGATVDRFTPPEATPAVPMDAPAVPMALSKAAQKIANQPPPFQPDPNATAAQNRLAKLQYEAENPVDKDQGFKGRLKEGLVNFLYGLGQTPPGASVKQALLLGGVGAGAGAFNRTWNEQRAAQEELPQAMKDVQFQTDQAYKNAQTGYMNARPGIAEATNQTKTNIANANNQIRAGTQKNINLRAIGRKLTFDPRNPSDRAEAKAAGLSDAEIEQMPSWNRTNPRIQDINGIKFERDQNGKYVQSNLPPDESKQLQDYEVKEDDAQGNQHVIATYKMLPKDAAKLQQAVSLQGQRLEAAAERQDKSIGAAATRQDKALSATGTRQDKALEAKRVEFETKFNADIAHKRQAGQYRKIDYVGKIQAAVQARTMTQEYANKLIESLPE